MAKPAANAAAKKKTSNGRMYFAEISDNIQLEINPTRRGHWEDPYNRPREYHMVFGIQIALEDLTGNTGRLAEFYTHEYLYQLLDEIEEAKKSNAEVFALLPVSKHKYTKMYIKNVDFDTLLESIKIGLERTETLFGSLPTEPNYGVASP